MPVLFLLFLLAFPPQQQPSGTDIPVSKRFDSIARALIQQETGSHNYLDQALLRYRSDTNLMRYFLDASKQANYLTGVSYAYNRLGIEAGNGAAFSRAVRYHQQGLEAALEAGNMEMRIFSLNMLGLVYRKNDAIRTALDYHQDALALAETIPAPTIAIKRSITLSLNSIGKIYKTLEQHELALQYFERSLVLEKELDNAQGVALNLENIGECYEAQGKLEEALEHYRTSLAYNSQANSARGVALCRNLIARVYIQQGKEEQALPLLAEARTAADSLQDLFITTETLLNSGTVYTQLGRYGLAEEMLRESLVKAKANKHGKHEVSARLKLARLYEGQGRHEAALQEFRRAKDREEEMKSMLNLSYVNDMIIRDDTRKKSDQIQMLAQENEIVKLKLKRNENTQLVSLLLLSLFSLIFYILYRQAQLKSEKKLLTLEQSMLRSQMNPHFLFNSLNSIKLFIINNEKKNAVHYLNKFSKLVRKILEASSVREITLAEELETVALYMNIENIRFNHEIHFEITVDNNIDPEQVRIPSLILQPFLENAIWHGLSAKEGKKEILLHVYRDQPSFITLSITDNGVGRAASEKLKKSRVLQRKSVGIDITKERLANFSKDYEHSFKIDILDLEDEHGKPRGTRVILHLPTR